MKDNLEISKFERFRMGVGTAFVLFGLVVLLLVGLAGFNLTLVIVSILLIVSGLLIAGSMRLAQLLVDLFN